MVPKVFKPLKFYCIVKHQSWTIILFCSCQFCCSTNLATAKTLNHKPYHQNILCSSSSRNYNWPEDIMKTMKNRKDRYHAPANLANEKCNKVLLFYLHKAFVTRKSDNVIWQTKKKKMWKIVQCKSFLWSLLPFLLSEIYKKNIHQSPVVQN